MAASSSWATSVFTSRPDDPAAVYVDPPDAQAAGDHHAVLQAALDRAGASPTGGIVFVPSGRYRITRTLIVWSGVRVPDSRPGALTKTPPPPARRA